MAVAAVVGWVCLGSVPQVVQVADQTVNLFALLRFLQMKRRCLFVQVRTEPRIAMAWNCHQTRKVCCLERQTHLKRLRRTVKVRMPDRMGCWNWLRMMLMGHRQMKKLVLMMGLQMLSFGAVQKLVQNLRQMGCLQVELQREVPTSWHQRPGLTIRT